MEQIKIEHYKSLMAENQYCLTQLQLLWLFKLSTLSVVLAVGVFSDKLTGIGHFDRMTIIVISLLSLPIISFIIDLKMLLFSPHLKTISKHLSQHFAEAGEIAAWEQKLWNKNPFSTQRTFLTIFSAVGLSASILLMACYFASILQPGWLAAVIWSALIALGILLIVSFFIIPRLLK